MTTSPTNNGNCANNHLNNHQKQMDCALKCTCKTSTSGGTNIGHRYSSLKSLKLNGANGLVGGAVNSGSSVCDRKTMTKKLKCDATTSPGRVQSKDVGIAIVGNELIKQCDELKNTTIGHTNPSPRRVVATRNAATSPNLDMRKHGLTEIKPKEVASTNNKAALEKSNSLGESKPTKQLRTTRSLSPRPPVRHQHAIMVSDENDIVSVKVSPNEDFELENGITMQMVDLSVRNTISDSKVAISGDASVGTGVKKKHKTSKSEQTSPNITDFDTKFSYNQTNNKSTGCLVYVPSDPWLKMSDLEECKVNSLHKKTKFQKMSKETRSLSRGNLEPLDNDPWIWRKPPDSANGDLRTSNIKKSPKQEIFRQAKSFSATKFELGGGEKTKSHRPKLQRCKSPLFIEDDLLPPVSAPSSPFLKAPENQFSPPPPPFTATSPPPPVPPHFICSSSPASSPARIKPIVTTTIEPQQQQQQQPLPQQAQRSFLDVVNPNLLQARHSFSSISQRDDELQLNIRRLSEQMRKTQAGSTAVITTGTGADFSDYLRQFRCSEAKKAAAAAQSQQQHQQQQQQQQQKQQQSLHHPQPKVVTQNNLDSMLETTC